MEIICYDEKGKNYRNKNALSPQWSFRSVICGRSGSGKTNLLLNLIYDFLEYDTITIVAKHLEQDVYEKLREVIEKAELKMSKEMKKKNKFLSDDKSGHSVKIGFFTDDVKETPALSEFDKEKQNLLIMDDVMTDKHQDLITEYWIKGRHKNISCFYLTQSYTKTPINIRRNSDYFFIFHLTGRDVNLIYADHVHGMTKEKFKEIFKVATYEPYSFMMIDLKTKDPRLMYRKKCDGIIIDMDEEKRKF